MSLAVALAFARDSAWDRCLTAALEAWRPHRQPAIADLIDRITVRAAGRLMTRREFHPRIREATDADVGELIKFCERGWRVGALELSRSRAPDPRISRLLHAMLTRYGDEASVISEIDRMDDPRDRERIILAARMIPPPYREDRPLLVELADSFARRPAPPPLDDNTSVPTVVHALAHHGGRFERIRLELTGDHLPPLGDLRGHARTIELVAGKGSLVITSTGATITGKASARLLALQAQI